VLNCAAQRERRLATGFWHVELLLDENLGHRPPALPAGIKSFFGTSENAVRTQPRIAISVYLLVAILKKRLRIPASL